MARWSCERALCKHSIHRSKRSLKPWHVAVTAPSLSPSLTTTGIHLSRAIQSCGQDGFKEFLRFTSLNFRNRREALTEARRKPSGSEQRPECCFTTRHDPVPLSEHV